MKVFASLIVPQLLVSSLAIGQENAPVRTFTPEQIYAASGDPYALEFEQNKVVLNWVTEKNGMTVVSPDFTLEQKRTVPMFHFEGMATKIGPWDLIADYVGTVRNHEQKLVELIDMYQLDQVPSYGVLTEVQSDSLAGKKVCAAALTAVYVDGERLTATPLGILKGCGVTRTAEQLRTRPLPEGTESTPEYVTQRQQSDIRDDLLIAVGYSITIQDLPVSKAAIEQAGEGSR